MARRARQTIPAMVECPGCGQMRRTVRGVFSRHSTHPTGPMCPSVGQPVTEADLEATANVARMNKVLLWAQLLRDEDPRHVTSWIALESPEELRALLGTALAAIPPNQSVASAFGWLRQLA